jgi:hypothetical protein
MCRHACLAGVVPVRAARDVLAVARQENAKDRLRCGEAAAEIFAAAAEFHTDLVRAEPGSTAYRVAEDQLACGP